LMNGTSEPKFVTVNTGGLIGALSTCATNSEDARPSAKRAQIAML
jgi:hypothetical protein